MTQPLAWGGVRLRYRVLFMTSLSTSIAPGVCGCARYCLLRGNCAGRRPAQIIITEYHFSGYIYEYTWLHTSQWEYLPAIEVLPGVDFHFSCPWMKDFPVSQGKIFNVFEGALWLTYMRRLFVYLLGASLMQLETPPFRYYFHFPFIFVFFRPPRKPSHWYLYHLVFRFFPFPFFPGKCSAMVFFSEN